MTCLQIYKFLLLLDWVCYWRYFKYAVQSLYSSTLGLLFCFLNKFLFFFLNLSLCSCIVFLMSYSCLSFFFYSSLIFFKRIILSSLPDYSLISISLGLVIEVLLVSFGCVMFPWLFMIQWVYICVCTFNKLGISSSLYRLSLEGKTLHQSAYVEILGNVHRWACCWHPWISRFAAWISK